MPGRDVLQKQHDQHILVLAEKTEAADDTHGTSESVRGTCKRQRDNGEAAPPTWPSGSPWSTTRSAGSVG